MRCVNAFFKQDDPAVNSILGYGIDPDWWSRKYEYLWALQFARGGDVCADMGCGWMPRPFKDALSAVCGKVYAVDMDARALDLPGHPNMQVVVADITKPIVDYEAGSLDRVYCLSVLEDLGDAILPALKEFTRAIKPDGRIIITTDVQYDDNRPLGKYPGTNLDNFIGFVKEAGLLFDGALDRSRENAVYHEGFNLCVWHCVLVKP